MPLHAKQRGLKKKESDGFVFGSRSSPIVKKFGGRGAGRGKENGNAGGVEERQCERPVRFLVLKHANIYMRKSLDDTSYLSNLKDGKSASYGSL